MVEVEKKRAYYGHMNIGDAAEETAFVAGPESESRAGGTRSVR